MAHTAFVTGADRGLGFALCAELLKQGWQVFTGQHKPEWPDLDMLAGQYPETLHIVALEVRSVEFCPGCSPGRCRANRPSGCSDQQCRG